MSEEKEPSMFQSFQEAVSSHVTRATTYVTQKIPFFSKDTKNSKHNKDKDNNIKEKASTDSFADPPPSVPESKNYTVLATSLTDVVSMLQAPPTDSKGLRDTLTKGTAILQDLKGTLLQGDPSARDQSHASAITDVIQNLEKLSKESATTVNTSNVATVMAIATTTLNTVASTMTQVSFSGIFNKIIEIIQQLIYPLLILYLASLVSNEMIVYPSPIRVFFFFFVLILCYLFSPATVILVFYYLVKAGYSYYRNELEERDEDTTKIRIYPRIFAILPITTTPATSFLGRLFKYPFHYPKTETDRKELERTDGKGVKSIMDEYMEVLKESFPYGETVKDTEQFAERYATVEKNMKRLHAAPAISSPTVSTDNLPPTLGSKGTPNDLLKTSRSLPAVIVPKASIAASSNAGPKALPAVPKALPAVPKALPAVPKALPGVITPTSTQANIIEAMASNSSKIPVALNALPEVPKIPALVRRPIPSSPSLSQGIANPNQLGGALKTRSPTSGGWLWNGI